MVRLQVERRLGVGGLDVRPTRSAVVVDRRVHEVLRVASYARAVAPDVYLWKAYGLQSNTVGACSPRMSLVRPETVIRYHVVRRKRGQPLGAEVLLVTA